jgi:ABC-type thiamine transport system substrate-binding protein
VRLILAGTVGLGLLFWMVEVLEEGEAEVVETLLDP